MQVEYEEVCHHLLWCDFPLVTFHRRRTFFRGWTRVVAVRDPVQAEQVWGPTMIDSVQYGLSPGKRIGHRSHATSVMAHNTKGARPDRLVK